MNGGSLNRVYKFLPARPLTSSTTAIYSRLFYRPAHFIPFSPSHRPPPQRLLLRMQRHVPKHQVMDFFPISLHCLLLCLCVCVCIFLSLFIALSAFFLPQQPPRDEIVHLTSRERRANFIYPQCALGAFSPFPFFFFFFFSSKGTRGYTRRCVSFFTLSFGIFIIPRERVCAGEEVDALIFDWLWLCSYNRCAAVCCLFFCNFGVLRKRAKGVLFVQ